MFARKRVDRPDVAEDEYLRRRVQQVAASDKQSEAILKDCHLLEAALATDRTIASLDENTARRFFTVAAQTVAELRGIVWVNPDKEEEHPIAWLRDGAPPERERCLGFRREPGG